MSKTETEIQFLIDMQWREIEMLLDVSQKKQAHMERLIKDRILPLMSGDSPAHAWEIILQHFRAISELQTLRDALSEK